MSRFRPLHALGVCGVLLAALVGCTDEGGAPNIVPTVISAGSNVTAGVTQVQAVFGLPNNGATPGQQNGGHREINWDAVAAQFVNNNNFNGAFFNTNSPRGVIISTPGSLRVSNNGFADLNASCGPLFTPFSPDKVFAPIGSNIVDVTFRVPGSNVPATVSGFGVVFLNVTKPNDTSMEFFDQNGNSLGVFFAPVAMNGNASLLAVNFPAGVRVARVRIKLGDAAPGPSCAVPGTDVVAMDDWFFTEPIPANSGSIGGTR